MVIKYKLITSLLIILSIFYANAFGQKKADSSPKKKTELIDEKIPKLHQRLHKILVKLKKKADDKGNISLMIESSYFYDNLEKRKYVFYKKVIIKMNQSSISKIEFEYYQFCMDNLIKEIKYIINEKPDSADLNHIEVRYNSSIGNTSKFKISEMKSETSQNQVLTQYRSYIFQTIYTVEILLNQQKRLQYRKINKIINLGTHLD